ncbi:MAG: hypothetical protein JNK82_15170 [Myxococcaceae bacterium]|nr:hypothetical protein [Myxococcaceae bacterium]
MFGTLMEFDGTTRITLSDEPTVPEGLTLAFDGMLETPGRALTVLTAIQQVVLEMPQAEARTRVKLWTNQAAEPDDVLIQVSVAKPYGHRRCGTPMGSSASNDNHQLFSGAEKVRDCSRVSPSARALTHSSDARRTPHRKLGYLRPPMTG